MLYLFRGDLEIGKWLREVVLGGHVGGTRLNVPLFDYWSSRVPNWGLIRVHRAAHLDMSPGHVIRIGLWWWFESHG